MLNVVHIELKDLNRKDFDSWFVGLLLKYDKISLSDQDPAIEKFKHFMLNISSNTVEVLSMNWTKMQNDTNDDDLVALEIFDGILWTEEQYDRLAANESVAVHMIERSIHQRRQDPSVALPFSDKVLLKAEEAILLGKAVRCHQSSEHPVDMVLQCPFKATDLNTFIETHKEKAVPLVRRHTCPIHVVKHAYEIAKNLPDKEAIPILFAILENETDNVSLKGLRVKIVNEHNYDLLLHCVGQQKKDYYYEIVSNCAKAHGLSLKVEEN